MSIQSPAEFERLRAVGSIVALVLRQTAAHVRQGIATAELDQVAAKLLDLHGARSAPFARPSRPPIPILSLFLTTGPIRSDTMGIMQVGFKRRSPQSGSVARSARKLADLKQGEQGVLERIDLPDDFARRLMELGFLPGSCITAARCAPGGDPRVFQVDGSEIALRRETAQSLVLQ